MSASSASVQLPGAGNTTALYDQLPREEFIQRNLGLARTCAGRFTGRGIDYEDLYAAGCLGLVKACDGFDPARGVCFSTYAVPVILGEIKKLFRDGGAVKVSRSIKELGLKINAERERRLKQSGVEPIVNQLAQARAGSAQGAGQYAGAGGHGDPGGNAGRIAHARGKRGRKQRVGCPGRVSRGEIVGAHQPAGSH